MNENNNNINYNNIIIELGNRIAQLTIDNAVLLSRIQDEIKNKEAVEKKYVDLLIKNSNNTAIKDDMEGKNNE